MADPKSDAEAQHLRDEDLRERLKIFQLWIAVGLAIVLLLALIFNGPSVFTGTAGGLAFSVSVGASML